MFNKSATNVKQKCNKSATTVKQKCNKCSTKCNKSSTKVQQMFNKCATNVQQKFNNSPKATMYNNFILMLFIIFMAFSLKYTTGHGEKPMTFSCYGNNLKRKLKQKL